MNEVVLSKIKKSKTAEIDYARSQVKTCGKWAIPGECKSGKHHWLKIIYCGREWCAVCGAKRSAVHNRRIARILPKILQIKSMGYFVIEFPDIYRKMGAGGLWPEEIKGSAWCYSKIDLNKTSRDIMEVLAGRRSAGSRVSKRIGGYFKRGLMRWHWFGDKIPGKYNPHINVLVDGEYINPGKLEDIKIKLRSKLNCPELIVCYNYEDSPGGKYHLAEYITRATFLKYEWSPYLANEIYNFRNQRWWGKWNELASWSMADIKGEKHIELYEVDKLQHRECYRCCKSVLDRSIKWGRPVDSIYVILWSGRELADSGYYEIPESEWNSRGYSPGILDGV